MVVTTQKALAEKLGTTDRSVRNWIDSCTDPETLKWMKAACRAKKFDVEQWKSWALTNGKLQGGGKASDPADTEVRRKFNQVKLARGMVALERERAQQALEQGKLVPIDVVRELLMDLAARHRATAQRVQRVSPECGKMLEEDNLVNQKMVLNRLKGMVEKKE